MVKALAYHQCGPGSNPGVDAICGLNLLLVHSLAPRGFSPGTLGKTNTSKFQFDLERPDTFQLKCSVGKQITNLKKFTLFSHIHLVVEEANNSLSWGQPSDAKCTDFIGLLLAKIY